MELDYLARVVIHSTWECCVLNKFVAENRTTP